MTQPSNEERAPAGGVTPAGRLARYGGIVVSLFSLAAVIWWASRQEPPELPADGGALGLLAGAVGLYAVAMVLRGERWLLLLDREGHRGDRVDAYALVVVGYMGNNVLPARGGDAIRVYLAKPRSGGTYRGIVGTLVAERILDAAFLLALFVTLGYFLLDGIDVPDSGALLAAVGVGAILVLAAAISAWRGRNHPLVRRAIGFVTPMASSTLGLRGYHAGAMVALTAAIWVVEAGTYWAAGAAVDLDMTALEALYIVALASVFILVPSGPGYVGTLDAALAFGARAVGASGAVAVSFLVAVRFVLLAPVTVVGLILLFTRYGGWASARTARASEPA